QYVYNHYGRDNAAQVANVITYRPKSSIRDMGKAFGHPPGQLDAWSKNVEGWYVQQVPDDAGIPKNVLEFARQVEGFPRHLRIHSGGMVICDRPVVEVCPVEWARMERSEEHTSELQSQSNLVCRLLLEKKKKSQQLRSPSASSRRGTRKLPPRRQPIASGRVAEL